MFAVFIQPQTVIMLLHVLLLSHRTAHTSRHRHVGDALCDRVIDLFLCDITLLHRKRVLEHGLLSRQREAADWLNANSSLRILL